MYTPAVSADGRYVAFKSNAWNLIPGVTAPIPWVAGAFNDATVHVYVRDRAMASTTIVGLRPDGSVPPPTFYDDRLTISDDGSLLAVSDYGGSSQLFDRGSGTVSTVAPPQSPNAYVRTRFGGGSMSGDGRYLAFSSNYVVVPGHVELIDAFVHRLR
jgi:hypothetical protein